MKYKHILEVVILTWWDRLNGNRYSSGCIVWDDIELFRLPFQYGDSYTLLDATVKELADRGKVDIKSRDGFFPPLWRVCDDNKVKLFVKEVATTKAQVIRFGSVE